ncbi:hypothetical protein NE237_010888 [Protea cynaroides]|uniref:V-type proton ATPase subunit S1/VOA1 transmembrane domain-containing protein n=1 Tax=Protea cynaroides TaxID=273540 RepID=A0A9Q0L063_9MAGN|nr:hypothetical protein NE237_010888 [Protea cynaroides]
MSVGILRGVSASWWKRKRKWKRASIYRSLITDTIPITHIGLLPQQKISGKKMKAVVVALLAFVLLANRVAFGSTSLSTVPAFLWSPYQFYNEMKEAVNYRTISSKDLAKSVLFQGGWLNLLCSAENSQQSVDVVLVFVGRELQSSHISRNKHADPGLLDLLKVSFMRSNFSMAFPYVAPSKEETMESSLISGFRETCRHQLGVSDVALLESCSAEGEDFKKLADLNSVNDYLLSRMDQRLKGQAHLIVFCHGGTDSLNKLKQIPSESEVLSDLISSVEQSGARYTVLYASDPYRSIHNPSYGALGRFLSESSAGNGSASITSCDGVCQIKSTLLEGVLVGIVLLIILISGLCCMMGIDTPTRFEAPLDS